MVRLRFPSGGRGLSAALATALLLAGCGNSDDANNSDASTAETPAPTDAPPASLLPGYVGTVAQSSEGAPCFYSRESLNAAVNALVANNKSGWADQVAAHAVALHAGGQVRRIDSGENIDNLINVRIESGANAGAACWLDRLSVQFTDVHDETGR